MKVVIEKNGAKVELDGTAEEIQKVIGVVLNPPFTFIPYQPLPEPQIVPLVNPFEPFPYDRIYIGDVPPGPLQWFTVDSTGSLGMKVP